MFNSEFLFNGFHTLCYIMFVIVNFCMLAIMKIHGFLKFFYLTRQTIHALKIFIFRGKKFSFLINFIANYTFDFSNIVLCKHDPMLHRETEVVNKSKV